MGTPDWHVGALYAFAPLHDFENLREPLLGMCEMYGVQGTLLLAREGINGTIAAPGRAGLDAVLDFLRADPRLSHMEVKRSRASGPPFHRMKVRLKSEIVTMGVDGVDPTRAVGRYVEPEDWNALIADPDTIVVDTRNGFEVGLGSFEGAVDPMTDSFREFPAWVERNRDALSARPRVAMFCTGGIRCEKATSWMVENGFEDVRHLKGGILAYLERVPESESLWNGDCFVFDERVAVGHGLSESDVELCRNCRLPLTPDDRAHPDFEPGVSCAACAGDLSESRRARLRERQKQVELAEARGERHIGRVAGAKG